MGADYQRYLEGLREPDGMGGCRRSGLGLRAGTKGGGKGKQPASGPSLQSNCSWSMEYRDGALTFYGGYAEIGKMHAANLEWIGVLNQDFAQETPEFLPHSES